MAGCCDPHGYDETFGDGFARRVAKGYRRKGLDPHAARMADFLAADGLSGATVLEIGGGVGAIGIDLVRRGAEAATTLELASSYDDEAASLAAEMGVADRVRRQHVDIATSPELVADSDLVVLHRVVCCYPDFEALLGSAADHCRARLAFSHPPRNLVSRAMLGAQNLTQRVMGRSFRAFVHPPAAMVGVVAGRGLRSELSRRGPIWQVQGLAR